VRHQTARRGEPTGYPNENRPTALNQPKPVSTGALILQLPFGFFGKTPVNPVFARLVPVIPWYAPVPLPFTTGAGPEPRTTSVQDLVSRC
jgi:hypothetical protein